MTAIALLNSESHPCLVADTLLSVEGYDPNEIKNIWLPALGDVPSEWSDKNGPWYISRLARKTFCLPNQSGFLAFAGDCAAAIGFVSDLAEQFLYIYQYDKTAHINSLLVDRVVQECSRKKEFSLIAILIDKDGVYETYIHNAVKRINTTNFGVCYVAGSGEEILQDIILDSDNQIVGDSPLAEEQKRFFTEDLAEHISSAMLYRESDIQNGINPKTSIALGCGGFYEWYSIKPQEIKPMHSRLDLHVKLNSHGVIITRAIFCKQIEIDISQEERRDTSPPTKDYYQAVYNLGFDNLVLPKTIDSVEWATVLAKEGFGILIQSVFAPNGSEGSNRERLQSELSGEVAQQLFGRPVDVFRVRIIATGSKQTKTGRLINSTELGSIARIGIFDGDLAFKLHPEVVSKMRKIVDDVNE